MREAITPVDFAHEDWADACHETLANRGQAVIRALADRAGDLADALADLSTRPVDAGFLHLYPVVVAIRESQEWREVHLELREVMK